MGGPQVAGTMEPLTADEWEGCDRPSHWESADRLIQTLTLTAGALGDAESH